MSITIYHNPRCSKSRQTLGLIEEKGAAHDVVEYLVTPPSAAELKKIVGMLGVSAKDIVRKKEAKEAGIDPAALSEDALIKAMAENPIVIERPIVVAGDKAVVGRPPENVLTLL